QKSGSKVGPRRSNSIKAKEAHGPGPREHEPQHGAGGGAPPSQLRARTIILAKVVVVTSGKGGVGKTTTSANLAAGLASMGYRTIAIDFDVGLRNLDLVMGCERRVVYDLINVIRGEATLRQAAIKDKRLDNLFILP